jgi:hypothetical protein
VDPLQLTSNGTISHSSDGNNWNRKTDIGDGRFADMDEDNNGYVYVIKTDGTVYMSKGDWTSWSEVVGKTEDSNFIAIAVDDGSAQDPPVYTLYAIQKDGDAFNTTDDEWDQSGDIGDNTDYIDMRYISGTGQSATLYAIRETVNDKVSKTTDGGETWATFGINIGKDKLDLDSVVNTGIVYGNAWGAKGYTFVLQTDGDIRYDGGVLVPPWQKINAPQAVIAANNYIDIDYESNSSDEAEANLWIVTTGGKTYKYETFGKPAGGKWHTLGSSGEENVVAIAVNEIPEFKDLLIPVIGTVAIVIFFRRRRKGKEG